MKFPRFYNPFARIRALVVANDRLKKRNALIRDDNRALRSAVRTLRNEQRAAAFEIGALSDKWRCLYNDVLNELDVTEQANEAFMIEREELKANIALRDAVGVQLVSCLMSAEAAITANDASLQLSQQELEAIAAEVLELRTDNQQQAGETLEVVGYVKACESSLAAAGIVIVDTEENGPRVLVDTQVLLAALKAGQVGTLTQEASEAA